MKEFVIRPHHILCINNFIGNGYSNEFSKNMGNIKKVLESNYTATVLIKLGCDDICNMCPHRMGYKCNFQAKVNIYDKNALSVLKINEGCHYSWSELCKKFNTEIILHRKLNEVCNDCSWKDICEKVIKQRIHCNK